MQENALRQERKYCARLGWALVLTIVIMLVWQVGLMVLSLAGRLAGSESTYMLLALVGYYLPALPLSYWLCRKIPVPERAQRPLTVGLLVRWFVIGIGLMWVGSLIGAWLNDLVYQIANLETVDMVTEAFNEMPLAVILLGACVLGPLCEELLFRGLMAGRLARYGQKPAALVSALLFGLYHANLSQFFYAFLLGLLLAYAYFYTGKLKTAVVLHMLFNLYGSFVIYLLPEEGVWPVLYALSWPVLTVVSAVLLVRGRKQQLWAHGPCAPSMRIVFGSVGMALAIILCFVQAATMYVY
ncbi:MAG TPA: CPBP family intramembrane metalloprotease [Candidatus Agathobaculum pullicola]|nr:CPBP family intramembrane metalloprotease [Candidatus Agathobaculum pullicola]